MSFIYDNEHLSPIRLPELLNEVGLAKHPHGLTAKHEQRKPSSNLAISLSFLTPQPAKKTSNFNMANTINHVPLSSPRFKDIKKSLESYQHKTSRINTSFDVSNNSSPTRVRKPIHSSDKENILYLGDAPKLTLDSSPRIRQKRLSPESAKKTKMAKVNTSDLFDLVGELSKGADEKVQPEPEMEEVPEVPEPEVPEEPALVEVDADLDADMAEADAELCFSADHIKSIREEHYKEIDSLEKSIHKKDEQILGISRELASTNDQFLRFDQEIKELKKQISRKSEDAQLLKVQLRKSVKDAANHRRKLDIKESIVVELENKIEEKSARIDQLMSEAVKLLEILEDAEFKATQSESLAYEAKAELQQATTQYEELLKEKESLLEAQTRLTEEKEQLAEERDKLVNSQDDIMQQIQSLTSQLESTQEIVAKKELLIEKLQQEKSELNQKFEELIQETKLYQDTLGEIEAEYKLKDEQLESNKNLQRELEEQVEEWKQEANKHKQQADMLKQELQNDDPQLHVLKGQNAELLSEIEELKASKQKLVDSNYEKDDIIRSDGQKIDQLVQKLNNLENDTESTEKINDLKQQLATMREAHNDKISNIAHSLFHQYSKKHQQKVALLKESQREVEVALRKEARQMALENETLRRRLKGVEAERDRLLRVVKE